MRSTTSATPDNSAMHGFWDNVRTILYALALAMVIRFAIAQPFRIPSASMEPTLMVGDYIVVTKWSFGYGRFSFAPLESFLPKGRIFAHRPERGDVVVFRPEHEPGRDFIKRVVGMPGDRIQMIRGVLYINGEAVQREDLGAAPMLDGLGRTINVPIYRETLPDGGPSYIVYEQDGDAGDLDNTHVFEIPDDCYFMMGDNRDNSDDSRRNVGPVPFDHLVGPAQFVVTSFDSSTSLLQPWTLFTGFRADRFLKPVE